MARTTPRYVQSLSSQFTRCQLSAARVSSNSKFSHAIQNLPYENRKNRYAVFVHAVFRHFLPAFAFLNA
jgi:hypothetical protein